MNADRSDALARARAGRCDGRHTNADFGTVDPAETLEHLGKSKRFSSDCAGDRAPLGKADVKRHCRRRAEGVLNRCRAQNNDA
jgi:hypothetical protein